MNIEAITIYAIAVQAITISAMTDQVIEKVEVWNRADCCADRLQGAEVRVGATPCGTLTASTSMQTVQCRYKLGSKIRILNSGKSSNTLTLCEVKVYGYLAGTGRVLPPFGAEACNKRTPSAANAKTAGSTGPFQPMCRYNRCCPAYAIAS